MQQVPALEALSFRRWLTSGTTCPAVMECDVQGDRLEFAVKLRGATRMHVGSLVNELLASVIASELGLNVPDPAIIKISLNLCNAATGIEKRDALIKSCGLNFGSLLLKPGIPIAVHSNTLTFKEREKALDIFVFDALIQNPDRRADKPNLLQDKDLLYVLDHELAFSFVPLVVNPDPWSLEALNFLKSHFFFQALQKKELNFESISQRIGHFFENGTLIDAIALIPDEWMKESSETVNRIRAHFEKIEKHQNEFFNCLTLLLT